MFHDASCSKLWDLRGSLPGNITGCLFTKIKLLYDILKKEHLYPHLCFIVELKVAKKGRGVGEQLGPTSRRWPEPKRFPVSAWGPFHVSLEQETAKAPVRNGSHFLNNKGQKPNPLHLSSGNNKWLKWIRHFFIHPRTLPWKTMLWCTQIQFVFFRFHSALPFFCIASFQPLGTTALGKHFVLKQVASTGVKWNCPTLLGGTSFSWFFELEVLF